MAAKTTFLHPMIYTGPKDEKDVSHLFPGGKVIVFALGPLSAQPGPLEGQKYANVTEAQGRRLQQVDPKLFVWPEGTQLGPQTVSREEYDALVARLEAIEAQLAGKAQAAAEPKGKKKAEPKAAAAPAEGVGKAQAAAEGEQTTGDAGTPAEEG